MGIEDTLNFLDEVRNIRAYDLEINKDSLSVDAKLNHRENILQKMVNLGIKYPLLEAPEKDYLNSLKRVYSLEKLDLTLEGLDLSPRLYNCIVSGEIFSRSKTTLGDIVGVPIEEFKKLRNFGPKTLTELKELVKEHGYELGQDIGYVSPENRK